MTAQLDATRAGEGGLDDLEAVMVLGQTMLALRAWIPWRAFTAIGSAGWVIVLVTAFVCRGSPFWFLGAGLFAYQLRTLAGASPSPESEYEEGRT